MSETPNDSPAVEPGPADPAPQEASIAPQPESGSDAPQADGTPSSQATDAGSETQASGPAYGRQRPLSPSDEVTWSVLTHLSPLLGFFTGVLFLVPLGVYLVLRERGPYVRHQTAESLNSVISYGIYSLVVGAVTGILTVITFGLAFPLLFLTAVVPVVAAVFWIIAAIQAGKGRWYRYPLILRFVR